MTWLLIVLLWIVASPVLAFCAAKFIAAGKGPTP